MTNDSELPVVVGAGPLGRAIIHELDGRGKAVRAVNRSGVAAVDWYRRQAA